jgi:hypothetical protein
MLDECREERAFRPALAIFVKSGLQALRDKDAAGAEALLRVA